MRTIMKHNQLTFLVMLFFVIFQLLNISHANAKTQQNKVLFVLSAHQSGYWLPEVIKPYKDLTDNGYSVDFASLNGAKGHPQAKGRLSAELLKVYQQIDEKISQPYALKNITSKTYQAIYFPGGAGPVFDLAGDVEVNRLVKSFYQENKIIAALCHGPAALIDVKLDNDKRLISGLKTTGKSNAEESRWAKRNLPFLIEDKFASVGSLYSSAKPKAAYVVYDFPLLTGQNPQSTALLSEKLVNLLTNQSGT